MSAPPVTNAAPVISWADADPSALSFTLLRGPDCQSLAPIDSPSSSPFTDNSLSLGGSDDGSYCYEVQSFDGPDPATSNLIDSGTATVVLDTTAPSLTPTLPSNNAFVRGSVSVPFTAGGTGSAIASVVLQVQQPGGGAFATVDSGASPLAWNTAAEAAGDDAYGLRIVATDAAGNSTTVTRSPINTDNTAPSFSSGPSLPTDSTFVSGTVNVSYGATDGASGSGVASVVLESDPPGPTSWTQVDSGTSPLHWDTTAEAAGDGTYGLRIRATDNVGNSVTVARTTMKVDNTAPSFTSGPTFPANLAFVHGTVSVPYAADDGTGSGVNPTTGVVLEVDAPGSPVSWAQVDSGATPLQWDTTTASGDGTYGIRVTATDAQGNAITSSSSVRVDNTGPGAIAFTTIGDPKSGSTYGRGAISIPYTGGSDAGSGTASIALQAQIGAGPWVTKTSGLSNPLVWTPTAPDDCTCSFRLVATDALGNQTIGAARPSVKIDGFDPVAPSAFNIDRTMTNGPPKLTWTASPSGDVAGYRIVRDTNVFLTGAGLVPKTQLNYTDNSLARDGTVDGNHKYTLYAVDQSGNASTQKVVNFFLDSVPPTTPTLPHAARRSGKALVDVSWSGSTDVLGPLLAPPSGVARYVVRRAVGAPPASVTAGQAACDVAASLLACVDSPPQGATYFYSVFAVDAASNASLAAHAGPVNVPDITPPGAPTAFKVRKLGLIMAFTWNLPKAADLKKVVIVKSKVHSPRSVTDGKVVYSGAASRAKVRQAGGTRAWYRMFAVDRAGNVSAGPAILITQPRFRLFPETGSELRGNIKLRWLKSKRASYYNVQLYLGSKRVTQGWPRGTSFSVAKSKLKRGRVYTWYVWPGIGAKARGRYGTMIGKSTFSWLG